MAATAVPPAPPEDRRQLFLKCVQSVVRSWGCRPSAIISPYPLPFPMPGLRKLDLVAFSEAERQDQETSCYAAHFCLDKEALARFSNAARPLATPLVIAGWPDGGVSVSACRYGEPELLKRLPSLEAFEAYARHEGPRLRAEVVAEQKWAATGSVEQRGLFGPGILDFAFEATASEVPRLYERVVKKSLRRLKRMQSNGEWQAPEKRHGEIPVVEGEALWAALLVLGARILKDKDMLESAETDACALLEEAASGPFRYFFNRARWRHLPEGELNEIAEALAGYSFRFLSPYGIGLLYERAFVSDKLRRALAIHYTPVSVANYVLRRLPIQDIPPEDRCVVDLTCGSGTFLHSALRRLKEIRSAEIGRAAPFGGFIGRVRGNDRDPFACALASLSLMMRTGINGWDITASDVRDVAATQHSPQPTIIVGNPPFALDMLFVGKCLEALPPGGLLGTVLPGDFRDQLSGETCRRDLLEQTDILEIFELPRGLFAHSNKPTVLLTARKRKGRSGGRKTVTLRSVGKKADWWLFLRDRSHCTEWQERQQDWLRRAFANMAPQRLPELWQRLGPGCQAFGESVGLIGNGMQFRGRDADLDGVDEAAYLGAGNPGGWPPYLGRVQKVLGPYALRWREVRQFVNYREYGERFHKAGSPLAFQSVKVLVPASTDERHPWRLRACVDYVGLFVSKRFYYILPQAAGPRVEEIAAVLNCPVASAWYRDHSVQRDVFRAMLELLPFPSFSHKARDLLIERVRALHAVNASRLARGEDVSPTSEWRKGALFGVGPTQHWMIRNLMLAIDDAVFDAYRLTEGEREGVLRHCPLARRPGLPNAVAAEHVTRVSVHARVAAGMDRSCLCTCGRVLAIAEQDGLAILSVDGLKAGLPVPCQVSDLPSAVRTAGRHFKAAILADDAEPDRLAVAALEPYPEADEASELIAAQFKGALEAREEIELGGEAPDHLP